MTLTAMLFITFVHLISLASLLLDNFLSQLKADESHLCKAVYLHVLPTNTGAISFYEKRNFRFHSLLWNYYKIDNVKMDGYCYVMYINGGEPPWNILYLFIYVNTTNLFLAFKE